MKKDLEKERYRFLRISFLHFFNESISFLFPSASMIRWAGISSGASFKVFSQISLILVCSSLMLVERK